MTYEHGTDARRMPAWLKRPIAVEGRFAHVESLLDELSLDTVCRSAKCPNRGECFSSGTATFLIMGPVCTRGCPFCAVDPGEPTGLDPDEPARVAEAARRMGLRHVVITSVTRDDLADGGAAHFSATVRAVRDAVPGAAVEVLTSDFGGDLGGVETVLAAGPTVYNHNLETVPRLYPTVRSGADYARSLAILEHVVSTGSGVPAKSGLMLGLGETTEEVVGVMHNLRRVGVTMLTLGQYLRPSGEHLPVVEFVHPDTFASLSREAYRLGFRAVASAPFVRSSYHAGELTESASV